MARVVITGGAGFIGSQLGAALCRAGDDVVLVDSLYSGRLDNLVVDGELFGEFVMADVRDDRMHRIVAGADVVYHMAGISALPECQAQPGLAYEVNVAGTANVLEAARRAGVRRVIFSSTSAVYECSEGGLYPEDTPIAPNLVYACTKAASEALSRAFAQNYGMDIVVPRFFNVYGPHQDFRRTSPPFTSYVARELAAGRTPTLFNDSDAKRDYVFSDDVIRALRLMAASERTYRADVFNIGSGAGFSVPELYSIFQLVSGRSLTPTFGNPERAWDAYEELFLPPYPLSRARVTKEVYKNAIADPRKTEQEFGWRASTPIGEGVAAVYAYALKHGSALPVQELA